MIGRTLMGLAALSLATASVPPAEEVVPSCYARVQIGIPAPATHRAVFVLIDQTTAMPVELSAMLRREAGRIAGPGTRFTVGTFSATQGGNFTRIVATGTIEEPVPTGSRNSLSVPRLRNLDTCLSAQGEYARRKLDQAIRQAAPSAPTRFEHSEILRALRDLAARVATTPAQEKIILIYSDMIEHSDVMSFYVDRHLRVIDPGAELSRANAQGLRGDLAGARVYVIGGALSESGALVDSRARDNLRTFWAKWLRQSGGRLVEFGSPGLINPVR